MEEIPPIRPGERRLGLAFLKIDSSESSASQKRGVQASEVYLYITEPDILRADDGEGKKRALKSANAAISRYIKQGFVTQGKISKKGGSSRQLIWPR
jgi:hypothetical protein